MRIVIAGAGKLGFSIAQLLAEDQFDVVVVEIDPKRKDVIQNTLDVLAIIQRSGASHLRHYLVHSKPKQN